jgi:hypothetical protein
MVNSFVAGVVSLTASVGSAAAATVQTPFYVCVNYSPRAGKKKIIELRE